jgi:hypothetical protein
LFFQYRRNLFFLKPKFLQHSNNFSCYTKSNSAGQPGVHPTAKQSTLNAQRKLLLAPTFAHGSNFFANVTGISHSHWRGICFWFRKVLQF